MTDESREPDGSDGMEYYPVIEASQLGDGERVIVDVKEREIAVFNLEGTYYALLNYCTHQGGPVAEGVQQGEVTTDENDELCYAREGEIVACPWHGWGFDIKTGRALSTDEYRIPTFEVRVRDGDVCLVL